MNNNIQITKMWQNQEEAFGFAYGKPAIMLELDMGCGKTLTTINLILRDDSIRKVLVVCPSKVIRVWRSEFEKHVVNYGDYIIMYDPSSKSVTGQKKAEYLTSIENEDFSRKKFVFVTSYESVWRKPLAEVIRRFKFDLVVLDESHRAKAAGSKVSKYLALLAKTTPKRLCLSGTPMANSPLDVYGQFRFLDSTIYGTRYAEFLDKYAILDPGGRGFPIGFKNQEDLMQKYRKITFTCKMEDIKDKLKLPDKLPPVVRYTSLNSHDQKLMKELSKDFISELKSGTIVVKNILEKLLRLQQITSGFCYTVDELGLNKQIQELNTEKIDLLADILEDLRKDISLIIFCVFRHDISACIDLCKKMQRRVFELSGSADQFEDWKKEGGVLVVQIQSGAEGLNMTDANTAIYFSLPHSLHVYEQSKARLYRPGQKDPVTFIHLLAKGTIDESMYKSLINKKDLITGIQKGEIDLGYLKK